jgi:hypothetical protein
MQFLPILLLAASDTASKTGDKVANQEAGFEWQGLALVLVTAMVVTGVVWWVRRWRLSRAQQMTNSPAHLLQVLCARHGLARPDHRLLVSLAHEQRLENPAQLFVDPRLWEPSRLGALGNRYAAQFGRLRERIFEL